MSQLHIVEIGKRKFASGLFWQSLTRPRELEKEAVKLATDIKADFMVFRKSSPVQVGFASRQDGAQPGLNSLAAAVAKKAELTGFGKSWLCAFELPDGNYAYVAVRDGLFLPDGDIAGSSGSIMECLTRDYGLGSWDTIIAPAAWGFPNARSYSLEQLLPHKRNGAIQYHKWWALESVEKRLPWKKLILGLIAAGIVLGSLYAWKTHKQAIEKQKRDRAIAQMREQLLAKKHLAPPVKTALPHPWLSMATPAAFIGNCESALTERLLFPAGWQLDSVTCESGNVLYSWIRDGGTIANLAALHDGISFDGTGDKATLTITSNPKIEQQDDDILSQADAVNHLLSSFQAVGMSITVTKETAPKPAPTLPGAEKKAEAAPLPEWSTNKYSFQSSLPPSRLLSLIAVPGSRITKIVFKPDSDGQWAVEGELYAN